MFRFFRNFLKKKDNSDKYYTDRDVLVGIVRNREQYRINTANNFYHIPAKRLYQLDMPLHYVALFKSDRMFDERESGIYLYGAVKSIKVVKRSEIKELPKISNEEYYRIDVEKWIPLKNPIKMQEISKTHMFTTFHLLMNSQTIPELYMLCEEDRRFYKFLYKQCSIENPSKALKKYVYKGIKTGFTRENIEIIYPDTHHVRYIRRYFYQKPYALFKAITEKR